MLSSPNSTGPREDPRSASRKGRSLALASFILALGGALPAAEVTIQLESEVTWSETPVILEVRITDPEPGMRAPELEPPPGLLIKGPRGPSTQMNVINGRRSDFHVYQFEVVPTAGRIGKFTIGPVRVPRRGGGAIQSKTVELHVYKKPQEGILFRCEVSPAGGPVGAPFQITYTVYYTGEPDEGDFFNRGHFGLSALDLPVLGLSAVELKPVRVLDDRGGTTLRISGQNQIYLQEGFAEQGGAGYKTLVFGFEATPRTTGPIEVGGASVAIRLKTGRTRVANDGFFSRRVAELKEYKASTGQVTYQVRELPMEGRPPGFTGAVGSFSVTAKADATEVDAFAPITLEIRVTGSGVLSDLKPAAWSEVESLTRDFEVSSDVDAGKVEEKVKVFRQVIRPRSETVTRIPPVPFPYYDPTRERYEVALSEPIPIKVRGVRTVTAEDAIRADGSRPSSEAPSKAPAVPRIVGRAGIAANFTEIGDSRRALDPREEILSAEFLACLGLPPALFTGLALASRLSRRDRSKSLRSRALGRAKSALASAGSDGAAAARALETYFRERLALPPGEVTPRDVAASLEGEGVPPPIVQAARDALERVHAARFGGAAAGPTALAEDARRLVVEVDRCLRGE
ncbi:MAG TPA: BatD family protein [Planctomycetota bacterium]|nr:BatD family protein [Planctomycetota bacterium]